jgi:hypothetical protein
MTRFLQTARRQVRTMINSAQGGPPNTEDDDDKQEPGLHRETVEDLEPKGEESADVRGGRTGLKRSLVIFCPTG